MHLANADGNNNTVVARKAHSYARISRGNTKKRVAQRDMLTRSLPDVRNKLTPILQSTTITSASLSTSERNYSHDKARRRGGETEIEEKRKEKTEKQGIFFEVRATSQKIFVDLAVLQGVN